MPHHKEERAVHPNTKLLLVWVLAAAITACTVVILSFNNHTQSAVTIFASGGAKVYYVNFAGGSDSNNGLTPATAWKHTPGDPDATATAASTTLVPGDVVMFKGGVLYNGTIYANWSGSAGEPIIYDGNANGTFGIGKAIINGQGAQLGVKARQYGVNGRLVNGIGVSYIVVNNFQIKNLRYIYDDRSYGSGPDGVYFNGEGTNITVENNNFSDLQKTAMAINSNTLPDCFSCINESTAVSVTATNMTDTTANLAQWAGTPGKQAPYKVTIGWDGDDYSIAWGYIGQATGTHTVDIYQDINLTIPGWNGADPVGRVGGYGYFVFNITNGSMMLNNYGAGIGVNSHSNLTIRNNFIEQDKIGISFGAEYEPGPLQDIYIYNNTIWNVSWGIQGSSGESAGQNLTNVNIYDNNIHDFYPYVKWGYWGGGWHNDGIYLFGAGASPTTMKNIQYYDNYFYGYIPGASAIIYGDYNYSNISMYNNIFAAIGSTDVRYAQGGAESLVGLKVYNNDFLDVPYDNISGPFLLTQNYGCATCLKNVTIRNNVFWNSEIYGADFSAAFPGLSYNGSDYNLLSSLHEYIGDIGYNISYTASQWQSNTVIKIPHDQNSVIQERPQFISYPSFAQFTANNSTTTKIYILPGNCDGCNGGGKFFNFISDNFNVGDWVEYNFDNVPREVTAIGRNSVVGTNYIIVSPALAHAPVPGAIIMDWKANSSLIYNLNITGNSPLIGNGVNLAGQIGTLDKAGNPRPSSGAWDIGAYEYEGGVTTISTTTLTTSTSSTATSSTPTSTTSSTPTSISSGGGGGGAGGGGGGAGGGGGGGTQKPIITNVTNGYLATNIAQLNTFDIVLGNYTYHVLVNYITPNYIGITLNGEGYALSPNETVLLNTSNHVDYNISLINISYIPILHAAALKFYYSGITNVTEIPGGYSINYLSAGESEVLQIGGSTLTLETKSSSTKGTDILVNNVDYNVTADQLGKEILVSNSVTSGYYMKVTNTTATHASLILTAGILSPLKYEYMNITLPYSGTINLSGSMILVAGASDFSVIFRSAVSGMYNISLSILHTAEYPIGYPTPVLLLQITEPGQVSTDLIASYPCSYLPGSVAPFELVNSTWQRLGNYTPQTQNCTVTIPDSPKVVGLFSSYVPVTTTALPTTTIATPLQVKESSYHNLEIILMIILVAVIVVVIVYEERRKIFIRHPPQKILVMDDHPVQPHPTAPQPSEQLIPPVDIPHPIEPANPPQQPAPLRKEDQQQEESNSSESDKQEQ